MSQMLMLIFFPQLQVYKTTPNKDHPFYQAKFQMHWDSKIILHFPPQKGTCYKASFFFYRTGSPYQRGSTAPVIEKKIMLKE